MAASAAAQAVPQGLIRVKVTYPDGRPVSNARVTFTMANSAGPRSDMWGECSSDGTCQRSAKPGSSCLLTAAINGWASPVTTAIVGADNGPIHLVVQRAAHIRGTITAGKEHRVVPGAYVVLFQRSDSKPTAEQVSRFGELSNVPQEVAHYSRADAQGRFEFFAAPGRYRIVGGSAPSFSGAEPTKQFDVKEPKDIEIDLHQDRPGSLQIAGHVTFKTDPTRGVPQAVVNGASLDAGVVGNLRATSNADGAFQATRTPCDMLVEAHTGDKLLAGISRISADDANVGIALGPTASVHARLIDQGTGVPVSDQKVAYRVLCDGRSLALGAESDGSARTDSQGAFDLVGMTPGWKYTVEALVPMGGRRLRRLTIATVAPEKPNAIELGDLKLAKQRRRSGAQ